MMRNMWKLILAIAAACVVFIWFIQPTFVSSYLTRKMHVPVSMTALAIRPSKTTIWNFQIDNPGKLRGAAFKAAKTLIEYHFQKLFANPVEIDTIELDDVYLNIYLPSLNVNENNWSAIGAKIPETSSDKAVLIHKLIINNLTVVTQGKGAEQLKIAGTRHFNRMEFDEINSANGFPTKELARRIFQDAGILNYLQQFLTPQNIEKAIDLFKSFKTENE
jgi:hypothetical protein